jgi:hypothetical protein
MGWAGGSLSARGKDDPFEESPNQSIGCATPEAPQHGDRSCCVWVVGNKTNNKLLHMRGISTDAALEDECGCLGWRVASGAVRS